jgi:hypothetical protein
MTTDSATQQQDAHDDEVQDGKVESTPTVKVEDKAKKHSPFGPGFNFGGHSFDKSGNAKWGHPKSVFGKQRPGRAAARGR